LVKSGSNSSRSPESCVLVVVAKIILPFLDVTEAVVSAELFFVVLSATVFSCFTELLHADNTVPNKMQKKIKVILFFIYLIPFFIYI
jgi:hypothetical protein